ncbi:GNAT family N-acetyltransferase [Paenibacillus eucommiae]|uniref:Mycothiol synthase n=1 Tax=Paenibacillus eucommiae TaxID=1355755 RepID=A0ABS4IRI9_9BACL|nr:GNAT family N-acetyltransferase [Paenibacillus eucommiae]MBP1990187.1 mycothiol synthase [Paenibacillus eucommiae]
MSQAPEQPKYGTQLFMVRDSLSLLPPLQLPEGYTLRGFLPGDEQAWELIMKESFLSEFSFAAHMRADKEYLAERVLFVCHEGRPVATASAWFREVYGDATGYVHMVGALPGHGGKGLGYIVSLAALYQMKEEGRTRAVLHTDDGRLPAVATYLKLGFVPQLAASDHEQRWEEVAVQLGGRQIRCNPANGSEA